MNATEFTARMDHLDESTRDLRTAPTTPPPRGEFFTREELLSRKRDLIAQASRLLARAYTIDEVIANIWGDE